MQHILLPILHYKFDILSSRFMPAHIFSEFFNMHALSSEIYPGDLTIFSIEEYLQIISRSGAKAVYEKYTQKSFVY